MLIRKTRDIELTPLSASRLNFVPTSPTFRKAFPTPCYVHTSQCPSAEHCLEKNSLKLHYAKITLATLEGKMGLPYDDEKYSNSNVPEPVKCYWHGLPCTSEDACLVATTRHLNQANALLTYLHRKSEQLAAERRGKNYGTKNQNGNSSQAPIIGYVAGTGATVHEVFRR